MEELKNKVFLVKVPTEINKYLKESNENKVGHLKIFLNKKRANSKPEFIMEFNKQDGPNHFSLIFNNTKDFFYFKDQNTKEDIKISNIDNFGKLVLKDEEESNKLIKNIYEREANKSNEIQVKEIVDGEKKYTAPREIQLSDKKFLGKDKKEKRVRKSEDVVIGIIKKEVTNNKKITPKEIADNYEIPENQVKEIMNKICNHYDDETRKGYYVLKDEFLG
jgi:hypothetical protein